jgi:segregation and condensation protein B
MEKLKSQIESLLFVSAKPMTAKQLAELSQAEETAVEEACSALSAEYGERASGLDLVKNNHKYQMVTRADNAEIIKAYLGSEINSELSRPSLETLTIIAYRGPIVKSDLDRIRGINCSMIIRNLLLRGLIEAKASRNDGEACYEVSFDFLKYLGIGELKELPDYDRLHNDQAINKFLNQDEAIDETPVVAEAPIEVVENGDNTDNL